MNRRPRRHQRGSGAVDAHVAALGRSARRNESTAARIRTRCSASSRAACTRTCATSRWPGCNDIGFDGYAIGGLSVGEPKEDMQRMLAAHRPAPAGRQAALPDGRRHAGRSGRGRRQRHRHVRLRDADPQRAQRLAVHALRRRQASATRATRKTRAPIDEACGCYCCQQFHARLPAPPGPLRTKSWRRLNTIHNLHYYQNLMREMRDAIDAGEFAAFRVVSSGPGRGGRVHGCGFRVHRNGQSRSRMYAHARILETRSAIPATQCRWQFAGAIIRAVFFLQWTPSCSFPPPTPKPPPLPILA